MIPRPAQYLLRFDDLCPTMDISRWQRIVPLIEEFGIHPILAVVPDNQDRRLNLAPADPEFWSRMQAMEAAGATIALHGYRHLCKSQGKSLLPIHRRTEFAGVHEEIQRQWIRNGLETLREHGLNPKIWVAPRHGFDRRTLRALRQEGIRLLSDGFARVPFTKGGVLWIPQQLSGPMEKSQGLWTICIHSNTIRVFELNRLHVFLRHYAAQFTTVERVLAEFPPRRLDLQEKIYAALALWRIRLSRMLTRNRNSRHRRRKTSV